MNLSKQLQRKQKKGFLNHSESRSDRLMNSRSINNESNY